MFSAFTFISNLLTKLVGPLLLWFGGRASARADAAEDAVKKAKDANEIDETVSGMSESDLDDQLRGDQ